LKEGGGLGHPGRVQLISKCVSQFSTAKTTIKSGGEKSGGKQNTEFLRENETLEKTMKSEEENNRNGMNAGVGSVRDGSTGLLKGSGAAGPLGTPDRGVRGGMRRIGIGAGTPM